MPWIRQSLAVFYEGFGANSDHSIHDLWWTVSLFVVFVLCQYQQAMCFFIYLLSKCRLRFSQLY
jgi:hypothetical protein